MNPALALFVTSMSSLSTGASSDAGMREETLRPARSDARASVRIIQPEIVDFAAARDRTGRATTRRGDDGTVWIEFR